MRISAALFFAVVIPAAAQKVEVPHKMDFAGITLVIRDDARREIQKDVDAFTASPRHYQIKAERAKTYFPIIEKIFREEGLPDDFKYLVLQESALISDAVSTSNAVGFWQFKDFTAIEMGLRVDRDIDERMNIAASTRAAARYLKKNNQFFDNWIYALQAYQMGAGGVMRSVEDTQAGVTRMEITGKTYWYVKKFLAHKIAYEGAVKGTPANQVVVYENRGHNTLKRLAKETMVDEEALRDLNKWARNGVIPDDRSYVVLLPVEASRTALALSDPVVETRVVQSTTSAPVKSVRGKINGVPTIQALPGDDVRRLTARAGVDLPKFLAWNDLQRNDAIVPGKIYYLSKKRLKGSETFHMVSQGETLWEISQKYGLQLKRLKRYNRIEHDLDPAPGTMLYLASRRPKEDAVLASVQNPVEVDKSQTFNWAVTTEDTSIDEVAPQIPPTDPTAPSDPGPVVATDTSIAQIAAEPVSKDVDSVKILQTNKTNSTLEPVAVSIPSTGRHTVQAGETLYGIARMYNLTVMEIVERNDLRLQDGIKPGQVLVLLEEPVVEAKPPVQKHPPLHEVFFHEVRTSDTLYSIARQYNVTINQIMEWNEKKDFSLAVGEKLRILSSQ